MRTLNLLKTALVPALLATAIAGAAQAKTVVIPLTPDLPGTITGTTALSAHEKVIYTFTIPKPYNFFFEFSDGIDFTTSGQAGSYQETFTNGSAASTGTYTLTTSVPEPASWAMMLVGFGALGAVVRRRKAAVAA